VCVDGAVRVQLVREWRSDFGNWRKVVHNVDGTGRPRESVIPVSAIGVKEMT